MRRHLGHRRWAATFDTHDHRRELEVNCHRFSRSKLSPFFVLAYVADPAQREAFAAEALALGDYWISNEAPSVFPGIAAKTEELKPPLFLLAVNGQPVAAAHPHGASLNWIAKPPPANRRRI